MVQAAAKKNVTQALLSEAREYAREILIGLNASPSHFHAVNYCKGVLSQHGFTEIKENGQWNLEAGKGYYFTRNGSTICAFLSGAGVAENPV